MSLTFNLDRDSRPINATNGSAFNARNVVIDKGYKAYKNEDGLEELFTLDYVCIGRIDLPEGIVLFSTNNDNDSPIGTGGIFSEIGIYQNGSYTKIITSIYLGFNQNCPIEGVYKYNAKGELIISFWHNVYTHSRPPMMLNLDNLPFKSGLDVNLELNTPSEAALANMFPDYDTPDIDIIINTGGQIKTGIYSFVIAYEFDIANITQWSNPTRWIPIADINTYVPGNDLYDYATDGGVVVNKSITLNISNLDTRYTYFRVGVISKVNGVSTFEEVNSYSIDSSTGTATVLFDGTTTVSLSTLDEVTTPNAIYKKVKTGTLNNKRLCLGNVAIRENVDYQKYANNIKVSWTSDTLPASSGTDFMYKKGDRVFYNRTWRPDEVHLLYIYFTFNDGSISEAFHIPGREARAVALPGGGAVLENLTMVAAGIPYNAASGRGDGVDVTAKVFHIHDTATSDGLDAFGQPYGTMGYWENENETYPDTDDFDIWDSTGIIGSLRPIAGVGQKVRHHRMPSIPVLNEISTSPMQQIIGLKFEDVFIPDELYDDVYCVNFAFAKKDLTQNIVVGESVLTKERLGLAITNNYAFFDFDLLSKLPAVGGQFLRQYGTIVSAGGGAPTNIILTPALTNINGYIDVIDSVSYVPAPTTPPAFSYMVNLEMLLQPLVAAGAPYLDSGFYTDIGQWNVGSLNQFRQDVCIKFYEQELVPFGYNFDKTDALHTGGGTGVYEYEPSSATRRIFAGDCFLSLRLNYLEAIDPVPPTTVLWQPQVYTFQYANIQYTTLPITGVWNNHNPYAYDWQWSSLMDFKAPLPYNTFLLHNTRFPHRIHRSIVEPSDGITENWRTFLPAEYYEMYKAKGEIWKLQNVNRTLLIHQKYSTFVAKLKDVLETGNVDAYLGEGDVFDRQPVELLSTNEGYAGCQSQFAAFTFSGGAFWCDRQQGKIFIYDGENPLNEISALKLRQYFIDNLQTLADIDNPFIGMGLVATYDDVWKRIIISKADITLNGGLTFVGESTGDATDYDVDDVVIDDGLLYVVVAGERAKEFVPLDTTDYTNNSFTLSYHVLYKGWTCWHDYYPNVFLYNRDGVYSVKNGEYTSLTRKDVYRHNYTNYKGRYYNKYNGVYIQYASYVDIIFNDYPKVAKLLESINWLTDYKLTNIEKYDRTISHLQVWDDTQSTDILPVNVAGDWFDYGTGRNIFNQWYHNNFRDAVVDNKARIISPTVQSIDLVANLNKLVGDYLPLVTSNSEVVANPTVLNVSASAKEYYELSNFISKFAIVKLIFDNKLSVNDTADLYINDVSIDVVQSSI